MTQTTSGINDSNNDGSATAATRAESKVWTTQDELQFLRRMYQNKNIKALRGYVLHAHDRVWFGPGMRVEAGRVILEARDLLKQLKKELAAK